MTHSRGFSLIELVVVMVIAAILAALAIPRLTDRETQASWYAEQVRAGLRHAQRQAVAQRRQVFAEVQTTQLRLCYTAGCAVGSVLTQISSGQDYVLPAPDGVTLAPAGVVAFDGLGQSAGATLTVAGQTITVQAGTGYVQ
jgi:MSHA pilin protein MshC